MADLVWLDGFDHYVNPAEKYTVVAGSPSIGRYGRNGSNGLRLLCEDHVYKTGLPAQGTWVAGCHFKLETVGGYHPVIVLWDGSTYQARIELCDPGGNSRMRLGVFIGSEDPIALPAHLFTVNSWYWLETKIVIHSSTGTVVVKVLGRDFTTLTTVVDFAGDTQNTTNATADGIGCGYSGRVGSGSQYLRIDNLYAFSGADAAFLGKPQRVMYLLPSAAGSNGGMTPSAGANYECVRNNPPNETDYVSADTAGQKDTYNAANPPAIGDIHGAAVSLHARKNTNPTAKLAPTMLSGVTEVQGTPTDITTSDAIYQYARALAPGDTAWNKAKVNALEIGQERTA